MHTKDQFTVVPEVGLKLGCQITSFLRLDVGYTFLWMSDVARPGNQIDTTVNRTQVPSSLAFGPLVGPARPAFTFRESDFWAHGVSLGLECRY